MITPVLDAIMLVREPEDVNDFVIGADADIAMEGGKGVDFFHFRMITPKRLAKLLSEDKIIHGRAIFVVNEPNMQSNIELVKAEINKFLPSCARETWEEVALAINCYLEWEYYDPNVGICDFYKTTMKNLEKEPHRDPNYTLEDRIREAALKLGHTIVEEP